jgi:hypothetical protein
MALDGSGPAEAREAAVMFTVGQPTRTAADVRDSAQASEATLVRVRKQKFCPDTEEVTGSNPVSPTSNIPSQRHFRQDHPARVRHTCD